MFGGVCSQRADAFGATLFLRLGSRRCTPKPPVLGVSTMDTGVVRAYDDVAIQMTASAALQPPALLGRLRKDSERRNWLFTRNRQSRESFRVRRVYFTH